MTLNVKFKKLNKNAVTPSYSKPGDAGLDLTAVDVLHDPAAGMIEYDTGIAVEIPEGYVGLLFPRSSVSNKPLFLSNSVGVLDSSYRGPIKFKYRLLNTRQTHYVAGERIGQLVILPNPKVSLEEVSELSESERGSGGFGSTGA